MNSKLALNRKFMVASPIEEIYQAIFGRPPVKSGTAYEHLATIAIQLLHGGDATHDKYLRGYFSETLYQIDAHLSNENGIVMGEAKDYSKRNEKVGRGDLQKLGGALPDLIEIDRGEFFSATGYTKPAKKYAESSSQMFGKRIDLYGLRGTTEADEEGRIKNFILNVHIAEPLPQKADWKPVITENGQAALKPLLPNGDERIEYTVELRSFFDASGNEILTLQELTFGGYGEIDESTGCSYACYWLPKHHILINKILTEIHGLEYRVPYEHEHKEIRISDDSEHRLTILDGDCNVLKIITDKQLSRYSFSSDGALQIES